MYIANCQGKKTASLLSQCRLVPPCFAVCLLLHHCHKVLHLATKCTPSPYLRWWSTPHLEGSQAKKVYPPRASSVKFNWQEIQDSHPSVNSILAHYEDLLEGLFAFYRVLKQITFKYSHSELLEDQAGENWLWNYIERCESHERIYVLLFLSCQPASLRYNEKGWAAAATATAADDLLPASDRADLQRKRFCSRSAVVKRSCKGTAAKLRSERDTPKGVIHNRQCTSFASNKARLWWLHVLRPCGQTSECDDGKCFGSDENERWSIKSLTCSDG